MPILRLRFLLSILLPTVCTVGCLGVPAAPTGSIQAPSGHRAQSADSSDPYEGWLFRKLTGQPDPVAKDDLPGTSLPATPNPADGDQS
ncbi:MAG: hypothetical protein U1E05_25335, partial [Patescibacteria group bacterium]|nr:hypothetical protein [Patescibacteria group bacterium]